MSDIAGTPTSIPPLRTVLCVHEDRHDFLTGVKLAILGLAKHAADLRIVASCPGASDEFRHWLSKQANASLVDLPDLQAKGWNVKAAVLLRLLDSYDEVIWMDSDIVVTGSVSGLLVGMADDVLVATEETYWGQGQGGTFRTTAWGLQPGRTLPSTVNSGILRVTKVHVPLLRAWQTMMSHPAYLKAQASPWYERPLHMIGDQEVLTALLGSTEFAHIPLSLLRRGIDIAQCFGPAGFTPGERIRAARSGCPTFIHAMGLKPWRRSMTPPAVLCGRASLARRLRNCYEYIASDVSPYSLAVGSYAEALEESTTWMQPQSVAGRLLKIAAGGSICLSGLPMAIFEHVIRFARRSLKMDSFSQDPRFMLTEHPFQPRGLDAGAGP